MITSYFTEQEKKYWETDNIKRLLRSFTKRFFSFYSSKESELPFDVKIFENRKKFNIDVDYFLFEKARQFYDYNSYIHEKKLCKFIQLQKISIITNIINENKILNLDISDIFISQEGKFLVLRKPLIETKNNDNEYHNLNGEAILWQDGTKEYYLYGVEITSNFFQKLSTKKYSFTDFVNERNEELKSIALRYFEEKYGNEYVVNFLREHLKEIDTYVDKKDKNYLKGTTQGMNVGVYTLFKGEISRFVVLAFVRCYCPSTDRMFFLGVNPEETNAKDAIASLYRIPRRLTSHIKYIQRQGERFSTVFTDRGNELLKKISERDFNDLTSISGDQYFSLMRYEY